MEQGEDDEKQHRRDEPLRVLEVVEEEEQAGEEDGCDDEFGVAEELFAALIGGLELGEGGQSAGVGFVRLVLLAGGHWGSDATHPEYRAGQHNSWGGFCEEGMGNTLLG